MRNMYFTSEILDALYCDYSSVTTRCLNLQKAFLLREYRELRAKEFAEHGFMRRIWIMARSIENVFRLLPPERTSVPTDENRQDAQINIQAFVFNAFGAIENLAWIWLTENKIKDANGKNIPLREVGLFKEKVCTSFSAEFKEYIVIQRPWFKHLENFRHALGHRIPLYIPPLCVYPKDEKAFYDLEARKAAALSQADFAEHKRLVLAQQELGFFRPWMTHSFSEQAMHVVFHPQLLLDFNKIDEIARKLLEELDR